jgi:hypothetical protein
MQGEFRVAITPHHLTSLACINTISPHHGNKWFSSATGLVDEMNCLPESRMTHQTMP